AVAGRRSDRGRFVRSSFVAVPGHRTEGDSDARRNAAPHRRDARAPFALWRSLRSGTRPRRQGHGAWRARPAGMMRADPLSFFALGGVAAAAEGAGGAAEGGPLDPGERALAGLAAQSSIYAFALPWAAGRVLNRLGNRGSVRWGGVEPLQGVKASGPPVTK